MKIIFTHNSIQLIPSGDSNAKALEISFIEQVLNLRHKNDSCKCKRVAPYGLDNDLTYIEIINED